jgi:hypothetical protein
MNPEDTRPNNKPVPPAQPDKPLSWWQMVKGVIVAEVIYTQVKLVADFFKGLHRDPPK